MPKGKIFLSEIQPQHLHRWVGKKVMREGGLVQIHKLWPTGIISYSFVGETDVLDTSIKRGFYSVLSYFPTNSEELQYVQVAQSQLVRALDFLVKKDQLRFETNYESQMKYAKVLTLKIDNTIETEEIALLSW